MTFRKQLIARKHRKMTKKNEEKQKQEKLATAHAGHPVVKAKIA